MSTPLHRRKFLQGTAAAGTAFFVPGLAGPVRAQGANEKLNVGIIGAGGRGAANLRGVSSQNVVALCDVDDERLSKAAREYPKAATFQDFRKLLELPGLDAVTVSTPDHMHAFATVAALQLGKHVYCEKPLTHSVYEARRIAEVAAGKKLATQMGNQGHSSTTSRRIVELIRSGALGQIREVHAWTNRPVWPQGLERPADTPPTPGSVNWDLWLGSAPERPYNPAYHPFKWRGWWDFGTGALGDMACHVLDAAFWALKLGAPISVEAEGPKPHAETAPKWMLIQYEFPARGDLPPVKLTWYDGGKLPPAEWFDGETVNDNGTLYVGERGKLYVPSEYSGAFKLLPKERFAGFQPPAPSIPDSPGHHAEWIAACKSGSPTGSNFAYATALTEAVLLGNVAYRCGEKLTWDSAALRATNCPQAEGFVKREYRGGWSL